MMSRGLLAFLLSVLLAMPAMASAATARQLLLEAAFNTRDKALALAQIAEADKKAAAEGDKPDAVFDRAMALGYHAKLSRNRHEAMDARRAFEKMVARDPLDPDAAASIGTWHLDSIIDLGALVAGMAIGAKKATGLTMMDRAVTLGGDRATFAGLAALLRLSLDPADPRGRKLAEAAAKGTVPGPLDRIMQRNAVAILASLKSGDNAATQKLARRLLPFGGIRR